jgi:hypothetical protein
VTDRGTSGEWSHFPFCIMGAINPLVWSRLLWRFFFSSGSVKDYE